MGILELDRLEATTFGDTEFERELIHAYVDGYRDVVGDLRSLFANDRDRLRDALHQLAGASGSLGAVRVGALALGIERALLRSELQESLLERLLTQLQREFSEVAEALMSRVRR